MSKKNRVVPKTVNAKDAVFAYVSACCNAIATKPACAVPQGGKIGTRIGPDPDKRNATLARGVARFVNVHASSGRRRKSRMKICTGCETPEEKEFNERVRAASGLCPQCRECNKIRPKSERFKRKRQNQWYRRTYGSH